MNRYSCIWLMTVAICAFATRTATAQTYTETLTGSLSTTQDPLNITGSSLTDTQVSPGVRSYSGTASIWKAPFPVLGPIQLGPNGPFPCFHCVSWRTFAGDPQINPSTFQVTLTYSGAGASGSQTVSMDSHNHSNAWTISISGNVNFAQPYATFVLLNPASPHGFRRETNTWLANGTMSGTGVIQSPSNPDIQVSYAGTYTGAQPTVALPYTVSGTYTYDTIDTTTGNWTGTATEVPVSGAPGAPAWAPWILVAAMLGAGAVALRMRREAA